MFGDSRRGTGVFSGLLWLAGACLVLSCRQAPDSALTDAGAPLAASVKVQVAPPVASAARPLGITWVDPPGLRRVPPTSPMYKASYVVPRAAGDSADGELAVFRLEPGQGGQTAGNIELWVSQFSGVKPSEVKRERHDSEGLHEQTVEISRGTYAAAKAPAGGALAKPNYALEAALVEGPNVAYSFKMTGPARTVAAGRAAFLQLLASVHGVRPEH